MQRVRRMGFRKGVCYLEHGRFIGGWMKSMALTMLLRLPRRKRLQPEMKRKPSRYNAFQSQRLQLLAMFWTTVALINRTGHRVPIVLRDVAVEWTLSSPALRRP